MTRTRSDDVETALNNRLKELGFGQIAWENTSFTDPGVSWVRPTFMPAAPGDLTSEPGRGSELLVGVYQVSVFAPLGQGDGQARDMASAVQLGFMKGDLLSFNDTVVQIGRSYRGPGRQDPVLPYFHVPVKVEFFSNL